MVNVQDFLARYIDKPMRWGVDDCSLLLADWWRANYHVDPAFNLRGTYSTEAEKTRIVDKSEGLLNLVSRLADSVGARQTMALADGVFAVILIGNKMVAGIYVGGFWAVRSETGIAYTKTARMVRAWAL